MVKKGFSTFLWLPFSAESGQGYKTVGRLLHGSVLRYCCSGYWNQVVVHEQVKTMKKGLGKTDSEHKDYHAAKAVPPLTLTATGQVRLPSSLPAAVRNTLLNLLNGGTEPGEITCRF